MPIYEYRCEPCDHDFEALIRNADDAPACPKCGNRQVAKQFSVPASTPNGGLGYTPVPVAGCGSQNCCMGKCMTD